MITQIVDNISYTTTPWICWTSMLL